MSGEPTACACGAALEPHALFCGRCGTARGAAAPLPPPPPTDPFVRAVRAEMVPHAAHAHFDGGALAYALVFYFLALGTLLVAMFAADMGQRVKVLRYFDFVLMGLGAVAMLVRWRDAAPAFRAPLLTGPGVAKTVAAVGGVLGLAFLLGALLPMTDAEALQLYRASGYGLGSVLLDISVLPSLGEEILFRVVILSALLKVFRETTAIVVSALLFASIHASPVSFLHLTALGVVLARVRIGTGSVYPCMAIHAGYNAIVVLSRW